jgi:vacuolar-type H+-ATPase subunit I/STV1
LFTPVPMQRVRILALKGDRDNVVALLHEMGAVQLEQSDRVSFFKEASPPEYASEVADQAFRFEGLVAALPRVPVSTSMEVKGVDDVLEKARSIRIDDDVRRLKAELENTDLELNRNRNYLHSLGTLGSFDKDLSVLTTKSVAVGFYSVPIENYDFPFQGLPSSEILPRQG